MPAKPFDPKETYIVREVFCCGEGHCPGIRFTHWESGEACPQGHSDDASNEDVHLYWRKVLIPLYRGGPRENPAADPYSSKNGEFWEWANKKENENKWCHFPMAPKEFPEGARVDPAPEPPAVTAANKAQERRDAEDLHQSPPKQSPRPTRTKGRLKK